MNGHGNMSIYESHLSHEHIEVLFLYDGNIGCSVPCVTLHNLHMMWYDIHILFFTCIYIYICGWWFQTIFYCPWYMG